MGLWTGLCIKPSLSPKEKLTVLSTKNHPINVEFCQKVLQVSEAGPVPTEESKAILKDLKPRLQYFFTRGHCVLLATHDHLFNHKVFFN